MIIHVIPDAGRYLLPMHIPVLLCGLVCGWYCGAACGAITPLLSWLFTSRPMLPMLPSMIPELAVYGAVAGLLYHFIKTKRPFADLYISLIGAMLAGRLAFGAINGFIFPADNYSLEIWATAAFVTALPGIVIQILLVPSLVVTLEKAKLIPQRHAVASKSDNGSAKEAEAAHIREF